MLRKGDDIGKCGAGVRKSWHGVSLIDYDNECGLRCCDLR